MSLIKIDLRCKRCKTEINDNTEFIFYVGSGQFECLKCYEKDPIILFLRSEFDRLSLVYKRIVSKIGIGVFTSVIWFFALILRISVLFFQTRLFSNLVIFFLFIWSIVFIYDLVV